MHAFYLKIRGGLKTACLKAGVSTLFTDNELCFTFADPKELVHAWMNLVPHFFVGFQADHLKLTMLARK